MTVKVGGAVESVGSLMKELVSNPRRFRSTDGYERLVELLRQGDEPSELKRLLSEGSPLAGDLLWSAAELDSVEAFVEEASAYLSDADKGTAAYAVEIVLRGARAGHELRAALDQLRICDSAVCEHAVRTLVGQGSQRLIEILEAVGYTWCSDLARKISNGLSREDVERLILDASRDRQVVGVVLATLAWERDSAYASTFAGAKEAWIRDYGEWMANRG